MSSPDPAPPGQAADRRAGEQPRRDATHASGEPPGQNAARARAEHPDRLPPALSSMWRLCRLGFRYEPALMGVAFVLALVAALPDALLAVWFTLLGEGLVEHNDGLLRFAIVALAVSVVATWLLQTRSTRVTRRFRGEE